MGISIDGTKLWQRSFEKFAVGELGSRLPLGSWVLLQGSETTQILRDLAHQENLNLDVLDVNSMQVLNEGGYPTPVVCVNIADTKAQVALSGVGISSIMILWHAAGFAVGTVFIVWVRLGREIQFCSGFGNGGG